MDTAAIRANTVTNPDDPEACYYYVDFPEKKIRYIVADTTDSLRTDRVLTAKKPGECVVLAIAPNGDKELFAVRCDE